MCGNHDHNHVPTARSIPAKLVVGFVWLYRITLGPLLGGQCRFYPTCSEYMIQAVDKHGFFKGVIKGCWRILRCQPFSKGGFDPP